VVLKKCDTYNHRPESVKRCSTGAFQHTSQLSRHEKWRVLGRRAIGSAIGELAPIRDVLAAFLVNIDTPNLIP
jgi:hypothetical protein